MRGGPGFGQPLAGVSTLSEDTGLPAGSLVAQGKLNRSQLPGPCATSTHLTQCPCVLPVLLGSAMQGCQEALCHPPQLPGHCDTGAFQNSLETVGGPGDSSAFAFCKPLFTGAGESQLVVLRAGGGQSPSFHGGWWSLPWPRCSGSMACAELRTFWKLLPPHCCARCLPDPAAAPIPCNQGWC